MKEKLKNKKVLIALLLVLIIGIILLVCLSKKDAPKEDYKVEVEKTYSAFVKINPLVKLTFKVKYTECKNKEGEVFICSDYTDEVIASNLINDDAKDIYDSIDFKGKSLNDSLVILCDVARDNKVAFDNLDVVSDYELDYAKIAEALKNTSKYEEEITVFVDFREHLEEDKVIEELEENKLVTYTISFDSNGGSNISKEVVKENELAKEPEEPKRYSYKFMGWYLNGEKYDFNTPVTKNFTLTAKWEKSTTTTTKKEDKTKTTTTTTTDNITSTMDKINLNENILVYESWFSTKTCGSGIVFSDNIKTVLKDYKGSSYSKYYEMYDEFSNDYFKLEDYATYEEYYDAIDADFDSKVETLTYNKTSAQKAHDEILKLLKSTKGLIDYDVNNDEKDFIATGHYLYISNESSLGKFGRTFNKYYYDLQDNIDKIINKYGGVRLASGGCGGGDEIPPIVLNEELCQKYNLNCARW